jgi:hypothetical protein
VLDSLEELTARTRAFARFLPDIRAADGPGRDRASFGKDYAALLRNLASPVRQLADLRTSPPRAALTAASDCQHQLEREQRTCPITAMCAAPRNTSPGSPAKSSARSQNTKPPATTRRPITTSPPEPDLAANDPPPTAPAPFIYPHADHPSPDHAARKTQVNLMAYRTAVLQALSPRQDHPRADRDSGEGSAGVWRARTAGAGWMYLTGRCSGSAPGLC